MLRLYNSLTQEIEPFSTIKEKEVSMYVCGITPYDTTHLGHAYTYIFFDTLVRFLKFQGYRINYTQNVTDINDRDNDILKKALEENTTWQDLSLFWTKRFLSDMKNLNWTMPTNFIYASEQLPSMIKLVESILKNGFGYEKNGSVYLDISKKKDFGKLSRLSGNEMLKVAKEFEEDLDNQDKKHPLDITLWRAKSSNQPKHIPSFKSPFSEGRPGWHIECSAMSLSTLGDQIDIHGGGIDLIFPHHESEIAQSEAGTMKIPFSKYWLHVSSVAYQGGKMSKSLGNMIMVSDLLKKYSSDTIRWYLISNHYRKGFEFKEEDIEEKDKEFKEVLDNIKSDKGKENDRDFEKFVEALENDMDTPRALEIIKEMSKKGSSANVKRSLSILGFLASK